MFKNMQIKTKLIIGFLTVMVLASLSGIFAIFSTDNINSNYSYAIKNYGFAQGDVGKLLACFGSVNVSVHDVIGYVNEDAQKSAQALYDAQAAKMDSYFDNVEVTIQAKDTMEYFQKAEAAWNKYLPLAQELMKAGDTTDIAVVAQVQDRLVAELAPLYDEVYNNLAEVMYNKVDSGNELEAQLTRTANNSIIFTIIMVAVAIILSVVLGTKVANGIAKPIRKCAERLSNLAKGDLKSEVPQYNGRDEVGVLAESTREIVSGLNLIIDDEDYLLTEMANGNFDVHSRATDKYIGDFFRVLQSIRTINHGLSDTLRQIDESSQQVSYGASQVSSAAQNLSQGAAEQAGSIDSLAHTITEISTQVSSNADNAKEASQKADSVGSEMEKSNESMQQMIAAMEDISGTSNKISQIISTIENIAFQTNILALNAAVEAARAGAAGKGFAVVADEVRSLANKSQEASKSTAELIEASVQAVQRGSVIADDTAKALGVAVEGAREVVQIVDRISIACEEQSKSVEMVMENSDQISAVVQTNSATAEESAAASEELSGQAEVLRKLVDQFQLQDTNSSSYAAQQSPAANPAGLAYSY